MRVNVMKLFRMKYFLYIIFSISLGIDISNVGKLLKKKINCYDYL